MCMRTIYNGVMIKYLNTSNKWNLKFTLNNLFLWQFLLIFFDLGKWESNKKILSFPLKWQRISLNVWHYFKEIYVSTLFLQLAYSSRINCSWILWKISYDSSKGMWQIKVLLGVPYRYRTVLRIEKCGKVVKDHKIVLFDVLWIILSTCTVEFFT